MCVFLRVERSFSARNIEINKELAAVSEAQEAVAEASKQRPLVERANKFTSNQVDAARVHT